jgi:hypothetical protein
MADKARRGKGLSAVCQAPLTAEKAVNISHVNCHDSDSLL